MGMKVTFLLKGNSDTYSGHSEIIRSSRDNILDFFDRSLSSSSIRINNDKKKIIKETGPVELLGRIVSKKTDGRQKKKQSCLLLGKIAATAM